MKSKKETLKQLPTSSDVKLIHVKVINGGPADIRQIGTDLKMFSKSLPYNLHAIVSNDSVVVQDAKVLLKELYLLVKSLEEPKKIKNGTRKDKVSNL